MKKILVTAIVLLLVTALPIFAYSKTGHEMFSEINFKDEGTLLVDMTTSQVNSGYKDMGRAKFIGWKYHYFNIKKEATYVGEVLFAKTNRSRDIFKVDYKIKDTETKERSITYGGSLSSKFKKNIMGIDMELTPKVDASLKNTTSNQTVQETSFNVVIHPGYKMVFREAGECLITNGVSKYYILGITVNKGEWEYIDVVTKYYELYEEKVS